MYLVEEGTCNGICGFKVGVDKKGKCVIVMMKRTDSLRPHLILNIVLASSMQTMIKVLAPSASRSCLVQETERRIPRLIE